MVLLVMVKTYLYLKQKEQIHILGSKQDIEGI